MSKKKDASDLFFSIYHKVPNTVKKYTDPVIKTGLRTERKFKPQLNKGKADADKWIDKHYTSKVRKIMDIRKKIKI